MELSSEFSLDDENFDGNFDENFDGNLMEIFMIDSMGWPYDSFDCLSLILEMGAYKLGFLANSNNWHKAI